MALCWTSNGDRCGDCRFWRLYPAFEDPEQAQTMDVGPEDYTGDCLRHAPAPGRLERDEAFILWPMTRAQDWCGEFEKRSSKKAFATNNPDAS